ncbi:MAG: hypothetical protein RLZZ466_1346, partial [Bacteroidota bacterium]
MKYALIKPCLLSEPVFGTIDDVFVFAGTSRGVWMPDCPDKFGEFFVVTAGAVVAATLCFGSVVTVWT